MKSLRVTMDRKEKSEDWGLKPFNIKKLCWRGGSGKENWDGAASEVGGKPEKYCRSRVKRLFQGGGSDKLGQRLEIVPKSCKLNSGFNNMEVTIDFDE